MKKLKKMKSEEVEERFRKLKDEVDEFVGVEII